MDSEYSQFAELLRQITDAEKDIARDKSTMEKLRKKIVENDDKGEYAVSITSHAFDQISNRLERVAYESPNAYVDIFECPREKSIIIPSNLTAFIISMVCKSREDDSYECKKSRTGGTEYVYTVNISKWSNDKELFFTCIVENNVVKTGYFNFVNAQ